MTETIDLNSLTAEAEEKLKPIFDKYEKTSFINTKKVLDTFREERVSESCFMGSTGYGYDDRGRDTLERIFAKVFGKEKALVRHTMISGTHALTVALFGLLRPGDTFISVAGKPYDTLDEVIGTSLHNDEGSLADYGISYEQLELKDQRLDLEAIEEKLSSKYYKVVYVQRSKGYLDRRTLSVEELNELYRLVKRVSPDSYVFVDNCYGAFVETSEPECDVMVGSLIKNAGGGMAETGAYVAGSEKAVEKISYRMTSSGIGAEAGATLNTLKNMYKGFFYAPHTVCQALKTATLAAYIFGKMGYETSPEWDEDRHDIIQAVKLLDGDKLCAFCRGIQKGSPVDAFVTPEPWDMPGYSDKVIMAAGTFTSGSSIELSADGPLRYPFIAYFQGGLTYESGKIGIISAAEEVLALDKQ